MTEKLDENFIKSLVLPALRIMRGKGDPYELVNGAMEYLISNKEKYMDHPNIKAIAVLKMKGLFVDGIRKNQKFSSMTDDEGNDLQVVDEKQADISHKISLTDETKKVYLAIKTMGEKCQDILMLAADDLTYKEMAEEINIPIGSVMSRLFDCRKKLKGLVA
ncbi:MAG: sigma-70 family RNA polymerase sigma factor [Pelagibacteraceae bacterium]|nr:sigma-70 family RNA polymerase sigma factor [Pelagibacteraceae bacterium]